jgi:hypothetical protein
VGFTLVIITKSQLREFDFRLFSCYYNLMSDLAAVQQAESRIGALYAPIVEAVTDTVNRQNYCGVSGPHRIGKSSTLRPALQRHFENSGHVVEVVSSPIYEGTVEQSIVWGLEQAENGVVIIDEAANPTIEGHEQEVLSVFKKLGYAAAVTLVAYPIDETGARDEIAGRWRPAYIDPATDIHLPPLVLPDELAKAYLEARGASEEVRDYILGLPRYLSVVALAKNLGQNGLRDLSIALTELHDNLIVCRGAIPADELRDLQARVRNDIE